MSFGFYVFMDDGFFRFLQECGVQLEFRWFKWTTKTDLVFERTWCENVCHEGEGWGESLFFSSFIQQQLTVLYIDGDVGKIQLCLLYMYNTYTVLVAIIPRVNAVK